MRHHFHLESECLTVFLKICHASISTTLKQTMSFKKKKKTLFTCKYCCLNKYSKYVSKRILNLLFLNIYLYKICINKMCIIVKSWHSSWHWYFVIKIITNYIHNIKMGTKCICHTVFIQFQFYEYDFLNTHCRMLIYLN